MKNLVCRYKHRPFLSRGRNHKNVIDNISLMLGEGETLGIVGESGVGKTTLARCITGLVKPVSGVIDFKGINIYPELRNRRLIKGKIQLLFQNHTASLDPKMTIYQSLQEALNFRQDKIKKSELKSYIQELLISVGLSSEILNRYPRQLSGGQRQRIAIARLLAVKPELLILDEPTSALDILTQVQILSLIKNMQNRFRFSIIYITHDVSSAIRFCERIAVFHEGKIVEEAKVSQLIKNPRHPYTQTLLSLSDIMN